MNKLRRNQSGFGAIEALLIIIIIVFVGVVGYMVYKNHNKSTASSANTVKVVTTTQIPTDWQKFTSKDGSVSFIYPKSWGTLTEAKRYSTYPAVTITKETDFMVLSPDKGSGPHMYWFYWDNSSNGLVKSEDLSPPDNWINYTKPVQLSPVKYVVDPISNLSGFNIYNLGGNGDGGCGTADYLFPIKDSLVDISVLLCSADAVSTNKGSQLPNTYTSAFSSFYRYQ